MQDLSAAEPQSQPAIDTQHLSRVTFGDTAFRAEILGLFLHESKALLVRLSSAKDDQEWRIAAHTLKGMARGIGAFSLADAAAEAEPLANGLRLERRGAELARISRLSGDVASEIETILAGA